MYTSVPHAHGAVRQEQHRYRGRYRQGHVVDCDGARVQVHIRTVATVVMIGGQIDALDTAHVDESLRRCISLGSPSILDLRQVTFLGVRALRALFDFHDEADRAGLSWSLVITGQVHGLVTVADRDGVLPVVNSVDEALRGLTVDTGSGPRQLLRIVEPHRLRC